MSSSAIYQVITGPDDFEYGTLMRFTLKGEGKEVAVEREKEGSVEHAAAVTGIERKKIMNVFFYRPRPTFISVGLD